MRRSGNLVGGASKVLAATGHCAYECVQWPEMTPTFPVGARALVCSRVLERRNPSMELPVSLNGPAVGEAHWHCVSTVKCQQHHDGNSDALSSSSPLRLPVHQLYLRCPSCNPLCIRQGLHARSDRWFTETTTATINRDNQAMRGRRPHMRHQ